MIWLGGIVLSVVGFLFGRVFTQSELVLAEKRRVYEAFLKLCPTPNDAYGDWISDERHLTFNAVYGTFMLYAAPDVAIAVGQYLAAFHEADEVLNHDSEPLHPAFKKAARAHNDVILEMRRDVLRWSVFAYRGQTRLPPDALEQARKKTL